MKCPNCKKEIKLDVEKIARVITDSYISDTTSKFPLEAKDIVILAQAISEAFDKGGLI